MVKTSFLEIPSLVGLKISLIHRFLMQHPEVLVFFLTDLLSELIEESSVLHRQSKNTKH